MSALAQPPATLGENEKRISTAAARAALLGGSLVHSLDDRGRPVYILTRWAYTREFQDLGAVERVLDVMGGDAP
jgi:hypothetical protein